MCALGSVAVVHRRAIIQQSPLSLCQKKVLYLDVWSGSAAVLFIFSSPLLADEGENFRLHKSFFCFVLFFEYMTKSWHPNEPGLLLGSQLDFCLSQCLSQHLPLCLSLSVWYLQACHLLSVGRRATPAAPAGELPMFTLPQMSPPSWRRWSPATPLCPPAPLPSTPFSPPHWSGASPPTMETG